MVAGSILPVAWHGGKLMFLFGKECNMEDSARGWSDFGGGCEDIGGCDTVRARTRKVFNTAVREGVEETTGFLGTICSIRTKLTQANRNKKIDKYMSLTHDTYTIYFMPIEYDEKLPTYYNDNHQLIWNNLNRKYINKTKLFEKIKIDWFSEDDMRRRRSEFRGFYRETVDRILAKVDQERKAFTAFAATATTGADTGATGADTTTTTTTTTTTGAGAGATGGTYASATACSASKNKKTSPITRKRYQKRNQKKVSKKVSNKNQKKDNQIRIYPN